MKKIYLLILLFPFVSFSQTLVKDSVVMGANYANQVWYSMKNGMVKQEPKSNWDIAFEIKKFSAGIAINSNNGVTLKVYPKSDINGWSSIDTSALSSINTLLYNSDTSWSFGAFNQNITGTFDYGWGKYNIATHNLTGDSIFIIKTSAGETKKIVIESLINDKIYNVKYANIDGTNEVKFSVDKDMYSDKNYVYYSFATKSVIDREPKITDWDLTFTQFYAYTQGQYYPVMGVLSNPNSPCLKVLNDSLYLTSYKNKQFKTSISEIGFDWKNFTNIWTIATSNGYYIQSNNKVYKMMFTGFSGASQGKSLFNKWDVGSTATEEIAPTFDHLQVFPNPTTYEEIHISLNTLGNNQTVVVNIFDIAGKIINTQTYDNITGSDILTLHNKNITNGIYILQVKSKDFSQSIKMIKN